MKVKTLQQKQKTHCTIALQFLRSTEIEIPVN